jgi:class 3 adenylate cyclase
MCAGGIIFPENHAYKIILAAFDIIDFVEQSKRLAENRINFKVRIGVNSGSIVAGIVGTKSLPMISGRHS